MVFWKRKGRVTMSGEQARAGSWGKQVLYVLIASLVLLAIVWVGLEIWGGGQPRIQ